MFLYLTCRLSGVETESKGEEMHEVCLSTRSTEINPSDPWSLFPNLVIKLVNILQHSCFKMSENNSHRFCSVVYFRAAPNNYF